MAVIVFAVCCCQASGAAESYSDSEVWRMELYLSVGIMALGLLSLLAVTSLPSVANGVNWREFSFIQVHTCRHNMHTHTHAAVCHA